MQALDLNLASNPFRNNTLLWTGYVTASVVLILFSVWNVTTYADHRARLRELRDTAGTFDSQRLDLETRGKRALDGIRRYDIGALELQAAKANEVIDWKAFSWTRLFNALERLQPNQVRMRSIRPIFSVTQKQEERERVEESGMPVALEGIAHDLAAFTSLERAMQEDPSFGRVEPNRLTRAENGELVFQMHAWYLFAAETPADEVPAAEPAVEPDLPAPEDSASAAGGARGAHDPEVHETWTEGSIPAAGEVQSATEPPAPASAAAAVGARGGAGR